MDPDVDERALIEKLVATWHLSVPERRWLPEGKARASLLLDAIEAALRRDGWYPAGLRPGDDYAGGLIERTSRGGCRIHWKTQVSLVLYESGSISEFEDPRQAALELLRSEFPEQIDGISIDWGA
jgi:hypothetical protein